MTARRFAVGGRTVDLDRAEVIGPDGTVALTPNEVKVLAVLAARAGQVVDRDVLLCDALGYRHAVNTRAIDQAIWRLRRKLEPAPHEPRWLLSEANVGYRLDLDPPAPRSLVGRSDELVRLSAMLEAPRAEVVVVGLPGSGRRALLAALVAARGWRWVPSDTVEELVGPDGNRTVRLASVMPADPECAVFRLGPLSPADGRALLIRGVLAVRGGATLAEEEEVEASEAAARAGHHPATLRQMALDSVLHRLAHVAVPPLPEVAAHVAGLEPQVRAVLAQCAAFPDPFLASEVDVPADGLMAAWRAGVLDGVDRGDAERWLVVPPCVRAVAPPDPGRPATRRFVTRVFDEAFPAAYAAIHLFDEASRRRLTACGARIDAALALATDDERRHAAPLWLARWIQTDRLPEPIPTSDARSTPDQAACLDVLQWAAAERVRRGSGWGHLVAAAARPGVSPEILGYVLRSQFTADPTSADVIAALEALALAHPEPAHLGAMYAARGVFRVRAGDLGGRADLVEALAQYGPTSGARYRILSDLAVEASMDGRAAEAIAWLDRADPSASAPSQEVVRRLLRVTALQACGRLDDAGRELALIDLLGVRRWPYGLACAIQLLLEGRTDEAVVVAESVRMERPMVGDVPTALPLVVGWVCVAQGHGDRALAAVAEVPEPWDGQFGPLLSLLHVAALARSSRPDAPGAARAALDALPAHPARWWAVARDAVDALVRDDRGAAQELEARMAATGVAHVVARFALAALAAPRLGPASHVQGNRPLED